MIQFLIHSKQGGGWGMGGTFQAFLWIMNLPYATHTALFGNLLDCSICLEFWLHRYLSLQLFLNCLQQQLEVSKNNYILFILCLEMSSQDDSWGFTLEHSILIRIPRMFLFCFANLIFIDEVKGGFLSTSGIKKYHIKRKQGETRWMVEARIFLWWPIPGQGCTEKIFTNLNPARVCESHPTPTEQATHTGEG